jgi:hypothetical protein
MNDPRIAKKISEGFIPVSAGIERLQPSRYGNPESDSSRWFQPMAKAALKEFTSPEWWENFQTYQGMYVVSPDAQCYDYRVAWQLPADKYLGFLEQALEKYAASEPKQISISGDVSTQSTSPAPDTSTTVLRVFSRIRPLPADCDDGNRGIGRDHMWIFEDEVQELLTAARKAQGKPFAMPQRITGRLVRFQLLDTVRNVSPAFAESDVKNASFTLQSLAESDDTSFSFSGQYASEGQTEQSGKSFGMRGWPQGEFRVNVGKNRIDHLRAYGEATASGKNNGGAPEDDYPIVFAITDAYDQVRKAVPPLYFDISPIWRPIYRNPKLTSL